MVASEPHVRRRGYFLSHEESDPEVGETESPEGVTFRVRVSRPVSKRQVSGSGARATSASHSHRRSSRPKASAAIHAGGHGPIK
jgi:hypothetical protein